MVTRGRECVFCKGEECYLPRETVEQREWGLQKMFLCRFEITKYFLDGFDYIGYLIELQVKLITENGKVE